MSSSKSRLVAATTRTSTGIGSVPPTGIASRSCSTRSRFTWVAGDISPISTRKNVLPRAAANSPCLSRTAPANDPFTWPNSSASSRLSGRALLRRAPANRDQIVVRERLLDVVERPLVHRLDRTLERGLGGHKNDGCLRVLVAHRREDLGARDARHLDVREHDVGRVPLQRFQ